VSGGDIREVFAEQFREPLDDVDRAVLTARTPDRDGQVAAVARLVLGDAGTDETLDVGDQGRDIRVRLHKPDDLGVLAGEVAQAGLPVRVRQRAGVKNEVGVARQAILEAEGFEGDGQAACGALFDAFMDDVT